MKITKSTMYQYLGWQDGYHKFRNIKFKSIEFYPEAKYIDEDTDVVLILKSNGTIEPSFSCSRREEKKTIETVMSCLILD
jgi:hypothetical protein